MECLPLFIHEDRMRGVPLNPYTPETKGEIRIEGKNETLLHFIIMDATVPLTLDSHRNYISEC
jgi:hypothetical protein